MIGLRNVWSIVDPFHNESISRSTKLNPVEKLTVNHLIGTPCLLVDSRSASGADIRAFVERLEPIIK